jgi:hypothetical protein
MALVIIAKNTTTLDIDLTGLGVIITALNQDTLTAFLLAHDIMSDPQLQTLVELGDIVLNVQGRDLEANEVLESWAGHGEQTGGVLHEIATPTENGFMSFPDKIKLDGIVGGGTSHGILANLLVDDHPQYQLRTEKGLVGGYASLDALGKVPTAQIPASALPEVHVVADATARLALTVQEGDEAIQVDDGSHWIYDGSSWFQRPDMLHVTGPVGATDRGVAIYSGSSGSLIQDSLVEITSGGDIVLPATKTVDGVDVSDHFGRHLTTGADPIPVATVGADGLMSSTDKNKLDGLSDDHGALVGLADDDHPQYQLRSEEGVALGYAPLDASSLLPLAHLPPHATTHDFGGGDALVAQSLASGGGGPGYLMETDGAGGWNLIIKSDGSIGGGGGGSSDHGTLTGLGDDDHTQYLLVSGSRAMSGSLNMGTNDITNVGLVDGVDVSAHAPRHESSGLDEVDGDHLDIDFVPTNYTRDTTPAEASVLVHLTAHLAGIDNALGGAISADHGALTGLGDDDHTQYLLVDGTRAMTGNLDMGTNAITNVGTVDGVDVSAHAPRHIKGGGDEVDGDRLDIDFTPVNYIPTTAPPEVSDVDHLTAHLAGIDTALGTGSGFPLSVKSGVVVPGSFSGSPLQATVTFSAAFASTAYSITATAVTTNNKSFAVRIESKLAGSFVIDLNTASSSDLTEVGWQAIETGES